MNLNIYRTIMRAFDLASECAKHPKSGAPHMELEFLTQKGVFTIRYYDNADRAVHIGYAEGEPTFEITACITNPDDGKWQSIRTGLDYIEFQVKTYKANHETEGRT